jgi:hypothetical protein
VKTAAAHAPHGQAGNGLSRVDGEPVKPAQTEKL